MIDITHIHPMLVHFPIVLFLVTAAIYLIVLGRGGDLAARRCLPAIGLVAVIIGVVAALLAAGFGDIALDAALDKGFDKGPLEQHEDLAGVVIAVFGLVALAQAFSMWRSYPLNGARGWALFLLTAAGVVLLLTTAYYGGQLVYETGVNVRAVKP